MEEIYSKKNVLICYDYELQSMYCEFKGFIEDAIYREARIASLKYSQDHNVKKWLTNHREAKVISIKMQAWLKEDFFPIMLKQAQMIAVVESEDIFNTACIAHIGQTTEKLKGRKAITRTFQNLESAKKWLKAEQFIAVQ